MQKTKIILIGSISLLIIVLVLYFSLNKAEEKDAPLLTAIPSDASIILETNQIFKLINHLTESSNIWKEISKISNAPKINNQFKFITKQLSNESELRALLSDKKTIISVHLQGKNKTASLICFEFKNPEDAKQLKNLLSAKFAKSAEITKRKYDNASVFTIKLNKRDTDTGISDIYFTYTQGIFIFTFSQVLIESAIRQAHSSSVITDDKQFKKVAQTAGKNVQANLYINYQQLPTLLKMITAPVQYTKLANITQFASWTSFDISLKNSSLIMAGYTSAKSGADKYLNLFIDQEPQSQDFYDAVPYQTSGMVSIGLNDFIKFKFSFEKYLKEKDIYQNRRYIIDKIDKELNISLENTVYPLFKGRISWLDVDFLLNGKNNTVFILANVKSKSEAKDQLLYILNSYKKENKLTDNDIVTEIITQKNTEYKIYKLPVSNMFEVLFGDIFKDAGVKYFTFFNNYLLAGPSVEKIKMYLNAIELDQTLEDNEKFNDFKKIIIDKSNLFFYSNIPLSTKRITRYLTDDLAQNYTKNLAHIRNFQSFALQFSSNTQMFYTNFALYYNPAKQSEAQVGWIAAVDTIITSKPKIVINHTTNEREILVQDASNKIYLLTNAGQILWKKQMPEIISSDIYQVDYYKNNKLQYLFSTSNYIHLIDRNGNYVENYPVKLKAPASNKLTVYDYENDLNYRLFIACKNKKVYLYNIEGNFVEGWNTSISKSDVFTPVSYFKQGDKDFLVFGDKLNTYIVNRKGETRVKLTTTFPKAQNSEYYFINNKNNTKIITTNTSGVLQFIKLDGSVTSLNIKNYTYDHYFILEDLNGDGSEELIFQDDNFLEVYSQNGKLLFNYYFEHDIIYPPSIFYFSKNDVKIGISANEQNKTYLFSSNGKISNGFPIEGIGMFSIGMVDNPNFFSMLIGGSDNYLYNYYLAKE